MGGWSLSRLRRWSRPAVLVPLAVLVAMVVIVATIELRPDRAGEKFDALPATVTLGGPLGTLGPGFFGVNVHDV
ncbi:MAG: hypothetical protein L3K07_05035, partial [Thermoplasmata archaeon]|nr:hypothetical protein [Thermoplasmata archaeon]